MVVRVYTATLAVSSADTVRGCHRSDSFGRRLRSIRRAPILRSLRPLPADHGRNHVNGFRYTLANLSSSTTSTLRSPISHLEM